MEGVRNNIIAVLRPHQSLIGRGQRDVYDFCVVRAVGVKYFRRTYLVLLWVRSTIQRQYDEAAPPGKPPVIQ